VGAAPAKAAVTSPTASANTNSATTSASGTGKDAYAEVAETSAACIRTGEGCVAHCNDELGRGNTAMANCNKRVHEMLAMVQTMLTLASSKSEFAKRHAANCADACKACAAACLEHKEHWGHGMHLPCKACYEACLACEASCRKLAAA
jgi:Cys-rich four helix bundle protein (predicted Tat secretion target)